MKLTHFMIHCASTPEGMEFDGNSILQWHMLPVKEGEAKIRYKGNYYTSQAALPDEYIGGLSVRKYFGSHGWRAPGYPDILKLDGTIDHIWEYNDNDEVEGFEITNGILSTDPLYRCTRHFCYIGGMDKTNKIPKDTRTPKQLAAMRAKIMETVAKHSEIKLIGHNQVNNRACPSFDVRKYAREIGVPEKNIDDRPLMYNF